MFAPLPMKETVFEFDMTLIHVLILFFTLLQNNFRNIKNPGGLSCLGDACILAID